MIRAAVFSFIVAVPCFAEVTPGEVLLAEMNCTACHTTTPEIAQRLASRPAPKLGADGLRITPQWLRAFLADPQKTKPGTLMPDMMHAVSPEEKTQMVEALTHYLISLQGDAPQRAVGASETKIEAGKALYHEVGCVQCHAPFSFPKGKENDAAAKEEFAKFQVESVPLGGPEIAKKYGATELAQFLRDPLKTRAGGRMPSLKLEPNESEMIAMFLLRDQLPGGKLMTLPGLQYEYYEQDFPELPEFDRLKPTATGVADTPSLKQAKRKGLFALRWRGNINAPKDGRYKFYTDTDDGSRIYLDGKLLVDNGGIHPKQERSAEIDLRAGPHSIVITYFDGGGGAEFDLKWRGPGIDKGAIPASAFTHDGQPMLPVGDAPFAVDKAKAQMGEQLYAQLQCGSCHTNVKPAVVTLTASPAPTRKLAELRPRQPVGCLSPRPKPGQAKFEITDRQRQVIVALLQNQDALSIALTPEQRVKRTMTTLNCYACHVRDRRGGAEGLRRDFFASVGEVDLGDEGRIPPALNEVGAKLQPAWMKAVLTEGTIVRPYIAARMPQFGAANVGELPQLFEQADARADSREAPNHATNAAADLAKHGRKLVGTIGGLGCIACHNFAGHKSLGVPAIDLATTAPRLKFDWFRRYLLDPQALRPGTRMPNFFPQGAAVNKDVLKGDTEQQIAALWLYFARKNFTDLPSGLVQGKAELVAANEAVIYRNFIDGGGPRAIGVGYPERANLCFDANDLRISMIWQGPFIDAARHRSGRGDGFEKPLGTNVAKLVAGPAFAVLADDKATWPTSQKVTAGAPFKGYRLDEKQRPTFRYVVEGFEVEDFPVAVPGEVDAFFRRTLTIKGAPPTNGRLYFRAATGKIMERDGVYLLDERVRFKFPGAQPVLRGNGDQWELLVPLTFGQGEAKLVEEIVW